MIIEATPIEFHPACQFEKLPLTPLQVQYLIFLRMQKSIYDLVQYNLSQGFLVSFKELYSLIESLTLHNWIINPDIKSYFKNIQINANQKINSIAVNTETNKKTVSLNSLLQLPFFRSLDPQLAEFLLQSGKLFQLKQNTFICKTGDDTRSLFVLFNGQAGIYKNTATVKQLIAVLNTTSVFGEAGFLLGEPRTADAITLTDCEVLVIPYNKALLEPHLNKDKASQLQYRFWVQHALLNSELFKSIPSDCLDALTFSGKIVELKKDKILFKQNDVSQSAYIVIQGEVLVTKDQKPIGTLSQGAFVGEISLMASKGLRTATISSTKDTLLLEIHRNEFYKLLSQNLYLAKQIESLVHDRLKADAQR